MIYCYAFLFHSTFCILLLWAWTWIIFPDFLSLVDALDCSAYGITVFSSSAVLVSPLWQSMASLLLHRSYFLYNILSKIEITSVSPLSSSQSDSAICTVVDSIQKSYYCQNFLGLYFSVSALDCTFFYFYIRLCQKLPHKFLSNAEIMTSELLTAFDSSLSYAIILIDLLNIFLLIVKTPFLKFNRGSYYITLPFSVSKLLILRYIKKIFYL